MNSQAASTYANTIGESLSSYGQSALLQAIVDLPFRDKKQAVQMDLGIVVLLLCNTKTGQLDRVALARTEMAEGAVEMSAKPFHDIKIPLDYLENVLIQTINTCKPHFTEDWKYLFNPALNEQQARLNQAGAGIECSWVQPLGEPAFGAMIYSFFQINDNIGETHHTFMESYTKHVANALSK